MIKREEMSTAVLDFIFAINERADRQKYVFRWATGTVILGLLI